jgi:hypothetical protein
MTFHRKTRLRKALTPRSFVCKAVEFNLWEMPMEITNMFILASRFSRLRCESLNSSIKHLSYPPRLW